MRLSIINSSEKSLTKVRSLGIGTLFYSTLYFHFSCNLLKSRNSICSYLQSNAPLRGLSKATLLNSVQCTSERLGKFQNLVHRFLTGLEISLRSMLH